MKKLAFLALLTISGCYSDTTEIKTFITEVQKNTTSYVAPMPEVSKFNHFDYSASNERSPFVLPQPEAIQERMQQMAGCLSPDPRRRKQPLEKFALDSLKMRGTLGEVGIKWALIEASDKTLHRVTTGNYLGNYNGKIVAVNDDHIKIVELVPDGAGCWVERESLVAMVDSPAEGQGK